MRYTVVWSDAAEAQLVELWLAQQNPAIQQASDAIDRLLAQDAGSKGIRRHGSEMEIRVTPLEVLFEISEADLLVRVIAVKNFLQA